MSPPGRPRATAFLIATAAATAVALLGACTEPPADRSAAPDGAAPTRELSADSDTARPVALTDAEDRRVTLDAPPERVVSLVPSATRTLQALGAADLLVGRTDFDTATALAAIPSVGGGLQPSLEVLVSLEPDLVIRFAGESDRETPAALDRLGIAHVAVRPERIADVREMIASLGRLTGRAAAADSLLAAQRRVLDSIRARAADAEPVRAAFTLGGDPPYVAGPGTFAGELIELAGGTNVFDDLERPWAGVSPETVVDRDPEVLVVLEGTTLDPRLTRGRRVRTVPSLVQLPGPDLERAALAVARALHPDLFGGT